MELYDLSGIWQCSIPGQSGPIRLPGTLDESGIGRPESVERQWHLEDAREIGLYQDGDPIVTRLTRRHTYEGEAVFTSELKWKVPEGKRIFLECERARFLILNVNGQSVPPYTACSVSTPYVFELTGLMNGNDVLTLISDNSYPGWPYKAITQSSAGSDETQTNWNGILGYIRLRIEEQAFIQDIRVYPQGNRLDVCAVIDTVCSLSGILRFSSLALLQDVETAVDVPAGRAEIWMRGLRLATTVHRWDLEEGHLYSLTASISETARRTVSFGIRDFYAKDGRFRLNDRTIFLRSETNCAVFPESGYPPMDESAWRGILLTYRSYGVNCMRFHSHCPPEAAFTAADELGMLMQPELSHWDAESAFSSEESRKYYWDELMQVLRMLANHPSFVMLTLGNELHADESGHNYMTKLLNQARDFDHTRLYANGSNTHYGQAGHDEASDFYTAMAYFDKDLRATSNDMRGWLNETYPDLRTSYAPAMTALREKTEQPICSFEIGQYEVLPDFDELDSFRGVTDPANLCVFHDRAKERGMLAGWKARVEASGELSLLCYRAEVEAALRTEGFGGISLLGLQDFPGQGTALVGMLNSHLEVKPFAFARPERFRNFFHDTLPLVLLPRCTYFQGETLTAVIRFANYGKQGLSGIPSWVLEGNGFSQNGIFNLVSSPVGGLTTLGLLSVPLDMRENAVQLTLTVTFCGHSNTYSIWVYPNHEPVCPASVHECRLLDKDALAVLASGGRVYLSPPSTKEALPNSVQGHFSTDFWSVGCFPQQEGSMGQLIDAKHPVFAGFPTDTHTDWQWWPMASQRAVILPENYNAIITELDSYAYLRPMAQLLEFRCGGGRLLFSTFGLQDLMRYPEACALQASIYRYLESDDFCPEQEIPIETIQSLVH